MTPVDDLSDIMLNAIRHRAVDNNDGKTMAQTDREWLLRYIAAAESQRPADSMECPMCGGGGYIVDITEAIEQAQAEGLVLQPYRAALKEQPHEPGEEGPPAAQDIVDRAEMEEWATGRLSREPGEEG